MQMQFKCADYNRDLDSKALADVRERLLSCGNRCPKLYPCGHRCKATCHSNECENPEECRKKTKVQCGCKLRKVEVTCDKVRSGFTLLCDTSCQEKNQLVEQNKKEQERIKAKEEEEQRRKDIEEYAAKFGPKTTKQKKRETVIEEDNGNKKKILGAVVSFAFTLIAAFIVYWNNTS